MKTRSRCFLFCLFLPGLSLSEEASLGAFSVEQAILQGREHSVELRVQQRAFERSKLQTNSIHEQYRPDLSLNLHVNDGDNRSTSNADETATNSVSRSAAVLSLVFPWGHKGELKYDEKISRLGEGLNQAQYQAQQQQLDRSIFNIYFEYVYRQQLLLIKKKFMDAAKSRMKKVQQDLALGRSSKWKLLNEESHYLNKLSDYQQAEMEAMQSFNALSNLLGQPLTDSRPMAGFFSQTLLNSVHSYQINFDSIGQVKVLQTQLKQKILEMKKVRKTLWKPKLELSASYLNEDTEGDNGGQTSRTVWGAKVNLPFPAVSSVNLESEILTHDIEGLKQRIHEIKAERLSNAEQIKKMMKIKLARLNTQRSLIDKKAEELQAAVKSYEIGRLSSLELQNLETLQIESQENYYGTLLEVHQHYSELFFLLGRSLLESER